VATATATSVGVLVGGMVTSFAGAHPAINTKQNRANTAHPFLKKLDIVIDPLNYES